jgi:hypothetical protein
MLQPVPRLVVLLAQERLIGSYSRLHNLLLRLLEAQPLASTAMLEMLSQTIEYGQATVSAVQANTQEIRGCLKSLEKST